MKKCPNCERTFDDAMKFCQTDGTPLVAVAENAVPDDVYKTTVGRQEDIAAAIQPDPFKTMIGGSFNKDESGDLLQIPDNSDPLKTMYATDEEMKREMAAHKPANEGVVEIAPLADDLPSETPDRANDSLLQTPAPPRFDEPDLSPPSFGEPQSTPSADYSSTDYSAGNVPKPPDSFGEISAPNVPSPFSPFEDKTAIIDSKNPFDSKPYTSPNSAIPSPFNESRPTSYDPPSTPLPTYKEPEPFADAPRSDPFNQPIYAQPLEQNQPLQPAEWTPPPAPEANWQNQSIGANTPFQPPAAGAGQNNTLSIISLVLGILSIPCCGFVIFGIGAAVTGFLAKKKADQNPELYGGRGMALAGMIIGIITAVIGLILTVLQIFFGALGALGNT
jgi:hypothetical protein